MRTTFPKRWVSPRAGFASRRSHATRKWPPREQRSGTSRLATLAGWQVAARARAGSDALLSVAGGGARLRHRVGRRGRARRDRWVPAASAGRLPTKTPPGRLRCWQTFFVLTLKTIITKPFHYASFQYPETPSGVTASWNRLQRRPVNAAHL